MDKYRLISWEVIDSQSGICDFELHEDKDAISYDPVADYVPYLVFCDLLVSCSNDLLVGIGVSTGGDVHLSDLSPRCCWSGFDFADIVFRSASFREDDCRILSEQNFPLYVGPQRRRFFIER